LDDKFDSLRPNSPVVKEAVRLAGELLQIGHHPGWLAELLSDRLAERFGVIKLVWEYPVDVIVSGPAPDIEVVKRPGETIESLDRRLRDALATLKKAAAAAATTGKRLPRETQATIARDAVWLYRNRVERVEKATLAREYCNAEKSRGNKDHLVAEHWHNDRSLVRQRIAGAAEILELDPPRT
jgi:hypothetical protein